MPNPRYGRARDKVPTAVIYLALVAVVALVGGWLYLNPKQAIDKNGCAVGGPPPSLAVLLVDRTDPLTNVQLSALRGLLEQTAQAAAVGTRIEVLGLDANWNGIGTPLFAACRPARVAGEDSSGDPQRIVDQRYKRLTAQLYAVADVLKDDKTANLSPVYEAIGAVTRLPEWKSAPSRTLVVLSDFLENAPDFGERQNGTADYKRLKDSPAWSERSADLGGASVEVEYVLRANRRAIQTVKHKQFVREWVAANGGRVADFTDVPW